MILELWMKFGPEKLSSRISPTAFYGGLTRGRRLVTDETRAELDRIFAEVRSGQFAKEWMEEVGKGMPLLTEQKAKWRSDSLEKVYQKLKK